LVLNQNGTVTILFVMEDQVKKSIDINEKGLKTKTYGVIIV